MKTFDPLVEIRNCNVLLDPDGDWPSFHDAEIYGVNFWSGDIRPEEDIWIGPRISVVLGILGPQEEMPFSILRIEFLDCDLVEFRGAGAGGAPFIYDLCFSIEERGFYSDGRTPLPPYIHVEFGNGPSMEALLSFRCLEIRGVSREAPEGPPYA